MPSILVTTTAAAAGATVNPLIGSQYEVLSFDAFVEFAIYADTGDTWTVSVFSGSDVLMQSSTAPVLATATISVSGQPPVANFTFDTTGGGCLVTFDGTISTGTAPLTYSWSFGDGGTAVGGTASNTYTGCDGIVTFVVTLSVTNSFGNDVAQKNVVPQP